MQIEVHEPFVADVVKANVMRKRHHPCFLAGAGTPVFQGLFFTACRKDSDMQMTRAACRTHPIGSEGNDAPKDAGHS